MPQETNLNVAPYFDDFDPNKNYYKVLFKPGYPVQARELTTLQSILQNQVEQFGNHVFKEGAKVIPGQTTFNSQYFAVELENSFAGITLSSYASFLVGQTIRGEQSGVRARVEKVLLQSESDKNNTTLYVSYISSNVNNASQAFNSGENLLTEGGIRTSNVIFIENETFATTISDSSTSTGSSFSVEDGVYFLRGTFVNVETQSIILDQYTNTPSYRIGFDVVEEYVTADVDPTLYDNSQGYNNYTAPGADRFKITAVLSKKALSDFEDDNFVEIATIQDGVVRTAPNNSQYNLLNDALASRTYEESGDYYVRPFKLSTLNSLNDNQGNNGVFKVNQLTYEGNTPSDDLALFRLSPGLAYIRGYRVETKAPTFLDVEKPRTTKEYKSQGLNYLTGPSVSLNNVAGTPVLGINTSYTVSLRNSRKAIDKIAAGEEVGLARVYDFALESGSYNATNLDVNEWDISLYDIQTYTNITLSQPINVSKSTFVKGKSSGATGFIKDTVTNSKALKLYDTKGSFSAGESFVINGKDDGRIALAITANGLEDVKSIYGFVGAAGTFNADTTLTTKLSLGEATVSLRDVAKNTSVVTLPNLTFANLLKPGNIVSYYNSENFILENSSTKGISTSSVANGQRAFLVDHVPGAEDVYLNGIHLSESEYVSTGSTGIMLNVASYEDDELNVNGFIGGIKDRQEVLAYAGQTVVPFSTTSNLTSSQISNTQLYINGIKIDDSQFSVYSGDAFILLDSSTLGNGVQAELDQYTRGTKVGLTTVTTTVPQTIFASAYAPGNEEVYLNGVKLLKDLEYTAKNGTSVSLNNATSSGDVIEIIENAAGTVTGINTVTAVGLQTGFAGPFVAGKTNVFYNGIKLREGIEYVGSSSSSIYISVGAENGDKVEIIGYGTDRGAGFTTSISENQKIINYDTKNNYVDLFVDGVKYNKTDFSIVQGGTSLEINYPLFVGDLVDTVVFEPGFFTSSKFTTIANQKNFSVIYTIGFVDVYVNGILFDSTLYTAVDGQTVSFETGLEAGDLVEFISYSTETFDIKNSNVVYLPSYAEIRTINTQGAFTVVTVAPVATITGICNGSLPSTTLNVPNLDLISAKTTTSSDNTLFTAMPRRNISDVNLSSSNLTIRKQYDVTVTNNSTNTISAETNETFLPFDEERYSLTFVDGTIEPLTRDMLTFGAGDTRLTINNVNKFGGAARLVTTLRKINVVSKQKENQRSSSIIVAKSTQVSAGVGTTTLNDGLAYGNYPYGTRVQDEEISLNVPDALSLRGVFESYDTSDPSAPQLVLTALTGPNATTLDLILGETIIGTVSNARGTYVEKKNDVIVEYVASNKKSFAVGEKITFEESGIEAVVADINTGGRDITDSYQLDNGQRDTFYDYARIRRIVGKDAPKKKIKVYFQHAFYDLNDTGDITTVNSYSTIDYSKQVPYYKDLRNTDMIDIRPRVSTYSLTEGSTSPFEFAGRSFTQDGNSAKNILAPDESILLDYSFYLPRIDKVYVNKNGVFKVVSGTPAEQPAPPAAIDDSIEVAEIFLPPYLYNTDNASVKQKKYKRFTMSDISTLEKRIKTLEKFTKLTALESETSNLVISDNNGINKFKSGFIVDSFKNSTNQDLRNGVKNSINPNNGEIRPSHYTTAVDLVLGSSSVIGLGQSSDPYADLNFATDLKGSNIRKTGDVVTLDYTTQEWLSQKFATRTEKLTPYLVNFWEGTVELRPSSDVWVDEVNVEPENLQIAGDYTASIKTVTKVEQFDSQIGFLPTIWNSWNTLWTENLGLLDEAEANSVYPTFYGSDTTQSGTKDWIGLGQVGDEVKSITSDVEASAVSVETSELSVGDIIPMIRSRNVEFVSKRLKPNSQMYAFFDGVDVNQYIIPKLIEVDMVGGAFIVGETIKGYFPSVDYNVSPSDVNPYISFRAAKSNHKTGSYLNPATTFEQNPYETTLNIPTNYSSTSTVVNVDIFSLANEPQGEYYGFINQGMKLYGESSGAEAIVQEVRLITDETGTVMGSFYIPDASIDVNPKFTAGDKVFKLTNSDLNSTSTQVITSVSEEIYSSVGSIQSVYDDVAAVKFARKVDKSLFNDSDISTFTGKYLDPLAQTFTVDDKTGVYLTRLDMFFQSKDSQLPVTCQIRSTEYHTPSDIILPFSEVTLDSKCVNVSTDASTATSFIFESPVYLEGGKKYAIVLLSNSNEYQIWTSRLGEVDIKTQSVATSSQILVSTKPTIGALYKSQNAGAWEPSIFDDMKFTLYRADFVSTGDISFFNPNLARGNGQVPVLVQNPVITKSRNIRLGLSTSIASNTNLIPGNTVIQPTTGASGNYISAVGIVSALSVTTAGIGYTPSTSTLTYSNISLQNVTGVGKNATANVVVQNGIVAGIELVDGGFGYAEGDVVTAPLGSQGLGSGFKASIQGVGDSNELILDNVQGNFALGIANTLFVYNTVGVVTAITGAGTSLHISEPIDIVTDGLEFTINHKNHGMHTPTNFVSINGVLSDVVPSKATTGYNKTYDGPIALDDVTVYENFEGVAISAVNPGYISINEEIIKYEGVANSQLIAVTRAIDGSMPKAIASGDIIYKYELNGVSLRRVNRTHNPKPGSITLNSYDIVIDMSDTTAGVNRGIGNNTYNPLYFNETKTEGGNNVTATQNIPYEAITPNVNLFVPNQTSLDASIRSVSGTSISGNEVSFIDKGFESIVLNETNYLPDPRLIASKINEKQILSTLPGNKSMTLLMNMTSDNPRLSPVIDTTRVNMITTSNRINSVVTDYAADPRVDSMFEDPSDCQYATKSISLKNPANSIKVYLNAHINNYSDLRVFYSISNEDVADPIFTPFPGYANLDQNGQVINLENSDGTSDVVVDKNYVLQSISDPDSYSNYAFTANDLAEFKYFRIKIVMTSTNQAYVPKIKTMRAIALA